MKEPEKTIGRMIEKEGTCFILYVETLETERQKRGYGEKATPCITRRR